MRDESGGRHRRKGAVVQVTAAALLLCAVGASAPAEPLQASGSGATQAPRFLPDDPIQEDPDRLLIPAPAGRPLSKALDLFQKTFTKPEGGHVEAANVNTLGEVPNSSWFTNRMSQRVMTIDELVRGPNTGTGPDMSAPWIVTGAKTEGVTPGFTIRDRRGDKYWIKLDPLHWPQMATSTEIIGSKFFHAFGYNVPEYYLLHWRPEYEVDVDVEVRWPDGHVDTLSQRYIEELLEAVPRRPDGTIQLSASKDAPGDWMGPFDFQGTRPDDPNDLWPHEDRRELRGYKIFTAWMNHNDSDSVNTLDMWEEKEDGLGYVVHYVFDFGTILGSGASQPHSRRVGHEYYIEFKPTLKSAATLGIWDRPWRKIEYEVYPSVGRFESEHFEPERWKPDYPNPAFSKMTLQDALWATRTVMRFSDEAIRAIVATGRYDDPAAEAHVARTLIERRDKIVAYYLSLINPVDGFEVETVSDGTNSLRFTNLGVEAGLATGCRYGHAWHSFGNDTGVVQALGMPGISPIPRLALPSVDDDYLMVKLSTSCPAQPAWASEVRVYVRNGDEPKVVGLERDDPAGG